MRPGKSPLQKGTHPLQKRREALGLTRAQMVLVIAGHGMNVTAQHYGDIERGKRWPGPLLALVLKKVSGVPVETLITFGRESFAGKVIARK